MTTRGIDVSHYNPCSNYGAAKAAIDWAYIKVSEGPSITDPAIGTHYNGFSGRPRGPYHFMHGSSSAEVANFVTQVRARSWELPPMLDAEYSGVTSGAVAAFMAEYQRQTGTELKLVYSSAAYFKTVLNPAAFITPRTMLWAARYYTNSPDFGTLGWDHPQLGIYQYWDKGSVPGFAGGIDLDTARSQFPGVHVAFDSTDFTTLFYNNAIQTYGNFSQLLADVVAKAGNAAADAASAKTALAGVTASLTSVSAKVDALTAPVFDYAALAAQVAPLIGSAVATAVADELERRLAS